MKFFIFGAVFILGLSGCVTEKVPPPHLERYATPRQGTLPRSTALMDTAGEEKLRPRASFELEAYVMRVTNYRIDKFSTVSPMDFTVAWGAAATETVQSALKVEVENRQFTWSLDTKTKPMYLTQRALALNIANMHIVPATPDVLRKLRRVSAGDSIRAQGLLVDIVHPTIGERTTSLSRSDSGPGSAEIFYVTDVEVLARR
jgi:hypothetical protein